MASGRDQIKAFWSAARGHPSLQGHRICSEPQWDEKFVPLSVHGDDVPVTGQAFIINHQPPQHLSSIARHTLSPHGMPALRPHILLQGYVSQFVYLALSFNCHLQVGKDVEQIILLIFVVFHACIMIHSQYELLYLSSFYWHI